MHHAPQSAPAAGAPCLVEFEPARIDAHVGETFELYVIVRDAKNLFSAPFHLPFNRELLDAEEVGEGDFLGADGKQTVFLKSIQADRGRIIVGLARLGKVGGRSGSGRLVRVKLRAKKPGTATLTLERLDFRDPDLKPIAVQSSPAIIAIE